MELFAGFINLIFIFSLIYLLYRKSENSPLRKFFVPAVLLKFLAGFAIGIIYTFYYDGGDTFNYFHDATILSEIAKDSPDDYFKFLFNIKVETSIEEQLIYFSQERALFTAKILSFFTLITLKNYWISGMYFSLISFTGMWYLANMLVRHFPKAKNASALGFLFFPSVLIWSSGVLKESLIMGALGVIVGIFFKNIYELRRVTLLQLLGILISLFVIWKLKYYYVAVLIPVLLATFITRVLMRGSIATFSKVKLLMIWFLVFFSSIALASLFYPTLNFSQFLFFLLDTHDSIYANSEPEDLIHFSNLQSDFLSLLRNIPLALFSGLFRPGFWDAQTLFQWFTAVENTLLLLFFVPALKNLFCVKGDSQFILLLSGIIYIVVLATFMAFSSPNFGTLMRYKIGFLPFLVFLIFFKNPLMARVNFRRLLKL